MMLQNNAKQILEIRTNCVVSSFPSDISDRPLFKKNGKKEKGAELNIRPVTDNQG